MAWIHYSKFDFKDQNIKQYHVDTRDFHIHTDTELKTDFDLTKILTKKNKPNFFFTPEEVKEILDKLFNESGGDGQWRMLTLIEPSDRSYSANWQLKYIRIYWTVYGFLMCNHKSYPYSRHIWYCPIDQKHLSKH